MVYLGQLRTEGLWRGFGKGSQPFVQPPFVGHALRPHGSLNDFCNPMQKQIANVFKP
jgi:hypothetical protein